MNKSDLKKIAAPREIILASVVLLVLIIMFFNIFYSPQGKKIKEVKEKVATLKIEQKGLRMEVDALTKRQKIGEAAASKTPNTKLDILNGVEQPEIPDVAALVRTMTASPFQQGVSIENLSYQKSEKGNGYVKTPLNLKIAGSFEKVADYLARLDQLAALVSLDALKLQSNPENQGELELEIAATLYQLEGFHVSNAKK